MHIFFNFTCILVLFLFLSFCMSSFFLRHFSYFFKPLILGIPYFFITSRKELFFRKSHNIFLLLFPAYFDVCFQGSEFYYFSIMFFEDISSLFSRCFLVFLCVCYIFVPALKQNISIFL